METKQLCAKCNKTPRHKKYSYCKSCLDAYYKERRKAKKQMPISKIETTIKKPEIKTETTQFKVSVIAPPDQKPIFYDVDGQLNSITRTLNNNSSWIFLFKGEAGTGKTTLIKYLQWKYKKPIIRVNVTVNTEAQELKGKYIIRKNDEGKIITEWVDGLVTTALRHNCWLQIEEVNFMQREHQSIFYSLFDERKEIILEDKDGEIVSNPHLIAFLTMNPLADIKPLLPALKSRIKAEYHFSHPTEARQKAILVNKHNAPTQLATQIAKTCELIRKRYDRLQISSREAESWLEMLKIKGNGYLIDKKIVLESFKHSVALKLTDDEVIRGGLISVAEAVVEGKLGYDEILNKTGNEDDDNDS